MKNLLLLFVFLLLSNFVVSSPLDRIISGTVLSAEDQSPLPGVSVEAKLPPSSTSTPVGVLTDVNGKYSLSVPDEVTQLEFRFVGLVTQVVDIGSRTTVDVVMEESSSVLAEVIVVPYGEESKKSIVGAVATIDQEVIANQQVVSFANTLQGTVPGVNIITSSGQPGENPTVRIRGVASINSDASPIYVVDGAVYSGNINAIDPNQIENISVLKDASASVLYGSRAANGVVLITTKTGKVGKPTIDVSYRVGVSERAVKDYEYVNAEQMMILEWEALYNTYFWEPTIGNPRQAASNDLVTELKYNPYGGDYPAPIGFDGKVVEGAELKWNTDWEDALLRDQAIRQDFSLGISGGSDKIKYFFGGSYLDQEGVVIQSDFQRISGRLNIDAELTDWLSIGIRQNIVNSEQNFPQQSASFYSNTIQYIRTMSNVYPIYRRDENGDLIRDANDELIFDDGANNGQTVNNNRPVLSPGNTVAQTQLNEFLNTRFLSISNIYAQVDFLKNFSFRTNYVLNKYTFKDFDYSNTQIGAARSVSGRISRDGDEITEFTFNNRLSFQKNFLQNHTIQAMLVQEYYDYKIEVLNSSKTGLPFDGLFEHNSAASAESLTGFTNQERLSSLLGRVQYNYDNRYFTEFSIRQDASTRYAKDSRVGTFFSIGASWVISDESFFQGIGAINFLKLRTSYGQIGNNKILDSNLLPVYFPYTNTLATGYDQLNNSGLYQEDLANEDISWEKLATFNIALDYEIFNNRFNGSIEYYEKVTTDLFFNKPLPPSIGFETIPENVGELKNTGIELSINGDIIRTPNFSWDFRFNVAFEKNEITKLSQEKIINGSKQLQVGKSIYDFFIEEWAGVDPETGRPMWYADSLDSEGEVAGKVKTFDWDNATRYYQKTALPWARGGLLNNFKYKGFDLSILIAYSLGGQVLDSDYQGLMHGGRRPGDQMSVDAWSRRWQKPGDVTDVPRMHSTDQGNSRSTRFLYDNTYMRVRNITLGYTLPKNFLQKLKVKSFRIFFIASNPFTFSDHEGLDPEQTIQGTTDQRSAVFKTYTTGINFNF